MELAIAQEEHALSLLLGSSAQDIERGHDIADLTMPPTPAVLPAALRRRRPDIETAEQQMVAADRSLDAARAAFMPTINLAGSAGYAVSSLIARSPLAIWQVGGSILAPIFDGGRLDAQQDQAAARRDKAAFAYRKVALIAFREVEDALSAVRLNRQREQSLTAERDARTGALTLATNRYRHGYSPFLEQIDAERALLSAQLALVQARQSEFSASISLYQALGGGWVSPQIGGEVVLESFNGADAGK
jgi:outer membrane protein TolC